MRLEFVAKYCPPARGYLCPSPSTLKSGSGVLLSWFQNLVSRNLKLFVAKYCPSAIDPSPPVGVPPVLALPPLLLSLFPLPLLSAVPTPFVPLFSLLRGGPFPISHWRTRLRPRGVKKSGMKVLELPKRSPALNPMDFRICHGRDTPQRAGVR